MRDFLFDYKGRPALKRRHVVAILVETHPKHERYLCGFTWPTSSSSQCHPRLVSAEVTRSKLEQST